MRPDQAPRSRATRNVSLGGAAFVLEVLLGAFIIGARRFGRRDLAAAKSGAVRIVSCGVVVAPEPSSHSPAALVSAAAGVNAAVVDASVGVTAQPVRCAGHERVVRWPPPDDGRCRRCGGGRPRKRIEVADDRSIMDRSMAIMDRSMAME